MKLESVRALKAEALKQVIQPMRAAGPRAMRLAVAAEATDELDRTPRLIAVGIAPVKDSDQFKLAVRVQRRGLAQSEYVERLRKLAQGEIDVRYVGRVQKRATSLPWHQERNRPLRIGGSVGHFKVTAGTLGGFVRSRGKSDVLILSNNHVLANENRCKIGDAVLQPGKFDGGRRPADRVATLHKFVPLTKGKANVVDCAVAKVLEGIEVDVDRLTGLGSLAGLSDRVLDPGLRVAKVGRTTGVRRGRISAFELDDLVIDYSKVTGNLIFDNTLEIESAGTLPFSDGGDSGSLIVDADKKAVAQLFAGSDQGGRGNLGVTYATTIRRVLDALKADLLF
jgi:hypothetical protein